MRKAPALVVAVALAFTSGALCEQARAATSEAGRNTEASGDRERVLGADALDRSLRRALYGGAIADADRDGTVSRDEAMRYLDARFTRMDADLDGVLGETEFVRAGPRRGAAAMKATPFARPRHAGFEAADLDGDGRLSPEEFVQAALLHQAAERRAAREHARLAAFRGLDADGDGRVSRDDFLAAGAVRFAAIDPDGDDLVPIWQFLAVLRF